MYAQRTFLYTFTDTFKVICTHKHENIFVHLIKLLNICVDADIFASIVHIP